MSVDKRIAAYIIDCFIIVAIYEITRNIANIFKIPGLPMYFEVSIGFINITLPSIVFFEIFALFVFKDFTFRNASIGKKLNGLIILDSEWKKPSIINMIKRAVIMQTLGCVVFMKYRAVNDNWEYDFVAWEYDKIKKRVIERKAFLEMNKKCLLQKGDYVDNMNKLYIEYAGLNK